MLPPIVVLAFRRTVHGLLAPAALLELAHLPFMPRAALSRARLQDISFCLVTICPRPDILCLPEVLCQPAVVVCLLGTTKPPWKVIQISYGMCDT